MPLALKAVAQVTAVLEFERQHLLARLEQRKVARQVRLRARVGLHVCVLGLEKLAGQVDGVLLDLVGELATAVPALARIALGGW